MMKRTLFVLALMITCRVVAQPPASPAPKPAAPPPEPIAEPAQPMALVPVAHVETRGNGGVHLVLVPGLMCDWTVFESFMERNGERYTMHAVTLPGFGGSAAPALAEKTPPSRTVWLDNAMAAVLKVVAEKKIDKPILVGHSLGGHLVLRLAGAHAGTFRGAVAIDGYPCFPLGAGVEVSLAQRQNMVDTQMAARMDEMTDEDWGSFIKAGFAGMVTDPKRGEALGEMCGKVSKKTGARYMQELLASDASGELGGATIPVMLIAADASGAQIGGDVLKSMLHRQLARAKSPTLVWFVNSKHFVMDDAPGALDTAIEQFVGGKPVDGSVPAGEPSPAPVKAVPVEPAPAAAPVKSAPEGPK